MGQTALMKIMLSQCRITLCALTLLCSVSCAHKIPPEYEWERGWETVRVPQTASARSLSGVVLDANGVPIEFALVELMTPDFKTRLDARVTDERGRFKFRRRGNKAHIRFRMKGFNDYELPVILDRKAAAQEFTIHMMPSS